MTYIELNKAIQSEILAVTRFEFEIEKLTKRTDIEDVDKQIWLKIFNDNLQLHQKDLDELFGKRKTFTKKWYNKLKITRISQIK